MAKLILLSNGKCDLKFDQKVKNFKRVEKFNYKKNFFKVFIDKNDSVYDIHSCVVSSWKTIEKGRKTVTVPDQITQTREVRLFNRIKGNPFKIALSKIMGEIDMCGLLS